MTVTPAPGLARDASPAQVHAFLAAVLDPSAYMRYQQQLGDAVLDLTVQDLTAIRNSAEGDGLNSRAYYEGWDDAVDRMDPDRNDTTHTTLITLTDDDEPAPACQCLPFQRYVCGHCPHTDCQNPDCGHCPCKCPCR